MAQYTLALREVLVALGGALDFVGVDDLQHGKRVAVMAASCARYAQWPEEDCALLVALGLLHDCGVSSTRVHNRLVEEWDWRESQQHADRGAELLRECRLLSHLAEPVRYHHTHWCELKQLALAEQTRRFANLIFLVDRVDALRAQHICTQSTVPPPEYWAELIAPHAGQEFDPELYALFVSASANDAFWLQLAPDAVDDFLAEWAHAEGEVRVAFEDLLELGFMFANIVDSKSPFTFSHSLGVKAVAGFLAECLQLPLEERESVILAALLHDLGKLRVEDHMLEKPGPYDEQERRLMHRHVFDTWQLLKRIHGFEHVARIAAMHHETLDGQGYPQRLGAVDLPRAARIVAIADVFQPLVQNRPYRSPMTLDAARDVMAQMVLRGKLDPQLVGVLFAHGEEAYQLARAHEAAVERQK